MKLSLVRPLLAGAGIAALASAMLTVPTARAAIEYGGVGGSAYLSAYNAQCAANGGSASANNTLIDNGRATSESFATTGTLKHTGAPSDVVDVAASGSATATLRPFAGGALLATGSGSATAWAAPRLATTSCSGSVRAYSGAEGVVELTQPVWATITVVGAKTGTGGGSGGAFIDGDTYVGVDAGARSTGTVTALLTPGDYYIGFQAVAAAEVSGSERQTSNYKGTYRIQFTPVGAGGAAAGKGRAYAVFGARNCASGAVAATITKKAAKLAKLVKVKVNGKKAATLKGKKLKKRTLALPAAPSRAANVSATITLKSGKKVTVTRSYLACS